MNMLALRIAYSAYFLNVPHTDEVLLTAHSALTQAVANDEDIDWEDLTCKPTLTPWLEFTHCSPAYLLEAVDYLYDNINRHTEPVL